MAALLPKRLRQAKGKYYAEQRNAEHNNCPKLIKESGPHIGLYCATHGTWLRWIPKGKPNEV